MARERALEAVVAAYWKPVYKYLRIRFRLDNEDAKDLTQGFFTAALEKSFFDGYDPGRARFRTYLRTCLERFVERERRAATRLKRGGGARHLPLDFDSAESELRGGIEDPEADLETLFRREWARHVFGLAVEALRARSSAAGKGVPFAIFQRHDLEADDGAPSYAELAEAHGISVTQVTNHLAWARRELRRLVLETLRGVTASEDEFRAEARGLLGADLG